MITRSAALLALLLCALACGAPARAPAAYARPTAVPAGPPAAEPETAPEPEPRSAIAPPATMPARYLRTLEFDPGGYSAAGSASDSPAAGEASDLLLGDLLFHSPATLGPRARALGMSCQSCHPNGATHAQLQLEGLSDRPGNVDLSSRTFRPESDDGVFDPVNIPSLRGCRYTPPYGRDGRTASLAEFIGDVISVEFDGDELPHDELAALVHYVLDLDFLPNAQLTATGRLSAQASAAARRGAAVFERPRSGFGGQSCASCHPGSTFFRDGRTHRLGTGQSPGPHAIDGGYETPTLLGLAETAPYFHDGRFATLRDVVDWFDQTFALALRAGEREDLVAYLTAVGGVDRPRDDRPLARQLDQVFAYLSLVGSHARPRISLAAIDAVATELHDPPQAIADRVNDMRARLAALRERALSGADPQALPRDARALRGELARLAADWAGALPKPSE